MTTAQYISRLNTLYHTGTATEHSYRGDLQNLIMDLLPDILVQFFKDGEFITEVTIGKIEDGEIKPLQHSFNEFEHLVQDFVLTVSQSIKSPNRLAKMMAGKALGYHILIMVNNSGN